MSIVRLTLQVCLFNLMVGSVFAQAGASSGIPPEGSSDPVNAARSAAPVSQPGSAAVPADAAVPPDAEGASSRPARPEPPNLPAPQPGTVLSDRVVTYQIDVRLEPETRTLIGRQTLQWTNKSPDPVADVQLHLYWNAFKNENSTFFRELEGDGLRFETEAYEPEDFGYIDVTSFSTGGVELVQQLEFIQPDDDNPDDQTVARIPLPQPVPPGGTATFEVTFTSHVPRVIARTGVYEDFYFIGQWFPKVGVLEYPHLRHATRTAWNCHQFHAHSEFYADFGVYDVSITVPTRYKVGATGQRVEAKENGDQTTTYRYHQEDVHDFGWTAWPGFLEIDEPFEVEGLPKVNIHLMIPSEQSEAIASTLQATKDALKGFGEAWFPYPYPQITVVVVPFNAGEAGGMEYPTLITTWSNLHPSDDPGFSIGTTIHEFGHQYWYGMLASNEFEEPWLDEGINTYGTGLLMDRIGSRIRVTFHPILGYPLEFNWPMIGQFDLYRGAAMMGVQSPLVSSTWQFQDGGDYSQSSYARSAATLKTLELYLGEETMGHVMRTYARRFAFHHPDSEDFFAVAEEVSGEDLDWFIDQYFRNTVVVDYAVTEISVEKTGDETGYMERNGARSLVKEEDQPKRGKDVGPFRSTVVVERRKDGTFPVTIRVSFDDGTHLIEAWDGRSRWKKLEYERQHKVVSAEVDPEHRVWFDIDRLNNGRSAEPSHLAPLRLASFLMNLEQVALTLLSSLI